MDKEIVKTVVRGDRQSMGQKSVSENQKASNKCSAQWQRGAFQIIDTKLKTGQCTQPQTQKANTLKPVRWRDVNCPILEKG